MSTDTLRLEGKPGTGKVAPGVVTPLKNVKAKPELTQQLVVSQATPHTPDIPHWKGEFPFPKDIAYKDMRGDIQVADFLLKVTPKSWDAPHGSWGQIEAMGGTANPPKFSAKVEKEDGFYRLHHAGFQLDIIFRLVAYSSHCWVDEWNSDMEYLTGRFGLTPEERKYWAFQHEMDHFSAWSHFYRYMLGYIFKALNTEFRTDSEAYSMIDEIKCNCARNFIVATARSHAFDEWRGAPLSGKKYDSFEFPLSQQFDWRKIDEGEVVLRYVDVEYEIQKIKAIPVADGK